MRSLISGVVGPEGECIIYPSALSRSLNEKLTEMANTRNRLFAHNFASQNAKCCSAKIKSDLK